MNVKYLRRIKLVDQPSMSYYETRNYSPILPGGKAYRFYFINEVKSFITRPSPGLALQRPGIYEISGVAYSGNGRISKVLVSADGGRSWAEAALQEPVLPKAFARFRMPWRWDGAPGTKPATRSRSAPSSSPNAAKRRRSRRRWPSPISITTASPAGASTRRAR
jgi:sulfane dehydrogenase subunit SoxC